jgi:hypothetical protein
MGEMIQMCGWIHLIRSLKKLYCQGLDLNPSLKPWFKFESFWTEMPGFFDTVSHA